MLFVIAHVWLDKSEASPFPTEFMIKDWVEQMQKDLISLADEATAGRSLIEIFNRNKGLYTIEQNDADKLVDRAAWNIEQLLRKRSAALEVSPGHSPFTCMDRSLPGLFI
uniref:Uncharacterized protein n=1 Tax=Knipowitschia caucasica TaxID=637954 RepID=A0AAV2KTB5_KNICA